MDKGGAKERKGVPRPHAELTFEDLRHEACLTDWTAVTAFTRAGLHVFP